MVAPTVDEFLARLDHPMKPAVERLRATILASDPELTERIKWKAPSFVFAGEDRVTFALYPADRIRLVLHRGVKVRDDVAAFEFVDDSGLVVWATPDRGVVAFRTAEEAERNETALLGLLNRWVRS